MKKTKLIRLGIFFGVLSMMAVHCTDPALPKINIVSPGQNAVFVADTGSYAVDVEVRVPLPGCGADTFPVDPLTFTATLQWSVDGNPLFETDVTADFGDGVLDPDTGAYVWTGAVGLTMFGDFEIYFTIDNPRGQGVKALFFRLEQSVAAFPGKTYSMSITGLKQDKPNCLLPDLTLGPILSLISGISFPLTLPSGQDIINSGNNYPVTLDLPEPLGELDVSLGLDEPNNDILITGSGEYTIDFTGYVPPPFTGFDCVITASASGAFNDIDPGDPDGFLKIRILDVQPSPGGTCNLSTPTVDCDLIVAIDGG